MAAVLGVALLAALVPVSAVAAPEGRSRNYIVTLDVANAYKAFNPQNRTSRKRIRSRAERTDNVTDRLAAQHDFRPRHRFERAAPGFSARLTAAQAAEVARDEKVVTVRPARRFRVAAQITPKGIERVKAAPAALPGPGGDVDVDIAILDTGVGHVGGGELNVAGGHNCTGVGTPGYDPDDWEDSNRARHGTHVAGIAAARDNDKGVVGVAPGARIWSVRVIDDIFGDEATVACGIEWAISTHGPDAPPGTQPIEVINMSLQGPRGAIKERCPGAPGDIIHHAICDAEAAGITVVVAAGNNGSNARRISPAGYDQVITVAAMSDYDGLGWGKSQPACAAYGNEKDDDFASYSNFGKDIDIAAPGTCVRSTTTGDGTDTKVLTGTSMASPHVAGAVARYLSAHPGTSPEKMRKLVRAAGRMDWNPRSDPYWSGVGSSHQPNRVLDVKALTGANDVKVWLFRDRYKAGSGDTRRRTRVDVQRAGGYAGQVALDVDGLPGAVGTSSFDDANLDSLTGLGTNLSLKLKRKGPEGIYDLDVTARGSGGDPSGSRPLSLTIDRSGPLIADLNARARGSHTPLARNGAAKTLIGWDASDAMSHVAKIVLQRKVGPNAWRRLGPQKGSTAKVVLKPGQANRFRVVATDSVGNKSTSGALAARLSVRDSKSPQLIQPATGGWRVKPARKAYGGSLLLARGPAGLISTNFRGEAVAVVAPVGPGRGTIRLRVDGGAWREVSLKAPKGRQRRVVFSRRIGDGAHQLEIEGFKGQTAIDAILIIR